MAHTELDEQIVVRLPSALRDAIKAKAETDGRTEAQEVRLALRHWLDDAPGIMRAMAAGLTAAAEELS